MPSLKTIWQREKKGDLQQLGIFDLPFSKIVDPPRFIRDSDPICAREEEKKTVGREKERVAQGKGNVLEPNFPTHVLQVVWDSRDSKFAKPKSLCKNV